MADVKVNLRRPDQIIPPAMRQAMLERAAAIIIGRIQRRTEDGKDVNGVAFAPYSEEYARLRQAGGRSTAVSLELSGNMLASMKIVRSSSAEAVIGFEGSASEQSFLRVRTKSGAPAKGRKINGGLLRQSLRATHRLAGSTTGAVVANALKAKGHNDGAGHLPRRHFFGINDDDRAAAVTAARRVLRLSR